MATISTSDRVSAIGAFVMIACVFWSWRDTIGQCGFVFEYFAVTTIVCGIPKNIFDATKALRVAGAAIWGLYIFYMIWFTECGTYWVQHFWMFWVFHFAFFVAAFATIEFAIPYKFAINLEGKRTDPEAPAVNPEAPENVKQE